MPKPTQRRLTATSMDVLAPLHAALGSKLPDIWRTITECIYVGLVSDTDPRAAAGKAIEIADILRAELGGQQPYLPKGESHDVDQQYRQLFARFNGRNIAQLAAESGLCLRGVYSAFAILRREEFSARQGTLDLPDAPP